MLLDADVRILPPQPASPVSTRQHANAAQNRAAPRHFADMTRSPCGIGPWKYHFGPLSPGAIFGVSFFTEHRGGEAPLEAIEPISPAAVSSEPAREVHQRPVYKPDTDKHSRVIAQGDLFEGASDRFPRRAAGLAQHDSDSPRLSGLHPVMCRVLRPNQSEKGSFGNHRPALRWLLPPRGLTPHQT
jgi:hypothetical protein